MDAAEFVALFHSHHRSLLQEYLSPEGQSSVASTLRQLAEQGADPDQLRNLVEEVLTDAFYSILLGLDGAGSLGDIQQAYSILDEEGKPVSEPGEIEAAAFEAFHGE